MKRKYTQSTLLFCALFLSTACKPTRDPSASPISTSTTFPETAEKLIFAGLSGRSPEYIDSGPDKGSGWMDVRTLEVRKGLKMEGFKIDEEWLTPARIEHEIRSGAPLCTYPAKWNNPRELFRNRPDRLYSIPLDFEEEQEKSLLVKRNKIEKFKPFIDPLGNIKIKDLLRSSLKTLLVRDQSYGEVSSEITETNTTGEQVIKKAYSRQIELRVIRDNRQLLEMLNADRFDYIFSEAIQDEDYRQTKINPNDFIELKYTLNPPISGLADPNLWRVSIVCGIHPLTQRAMPWINQLIAQIRNPNWKARKSDYEYSYRRKGKAVRPILSTFFLVSRLQEQLKAGLADDWYPLQQKQVSGLELFPPAKKTEAASTSTALNSEQITQPQPNPWQFEQDGERLTVSGETPFFLSGNELPFYERGRFYHNSTYGWHMSFMTRPFGGIAGSYKTEWRHPRPLLELPSLLTQATKEVHQLTLFASGLKVQQDSKEGQALARILGSRELEAITLVDGSESTVRFVLEQIHTGIKHLDLTRSNLSSKELQERLVLKTEQMKDLQTLILTSTLVSSPTLAKIFDQSSARLVKLGVGDLSDGWRQEAIQAFMNQEWPKLTHLDFIAAPFSPPELEQILNHLPRGLEFLQIGRTGGSVSQFLKTLSTQLPRLKTLDLGMFNWSPPSPSKPISLPNSLRNLDLGQIRQTVDFGLFTMPPALESLAVIDSWWPVAGLQEQLPRLASHVKLLNLSQAEIDNTFLESLVSQRQIKKIDILNLENNSLDDSSVEILTRASFEVESLNLGRNHIHNQGVKRIVSRFLPQLRSLLLDDNPISEEGIAALALALSKGREKGSRLEILGLSGMLDLNISALAKSLPPTLKSLDFSHNLIGDKDFEILARHLPPGLAVLNLSYSKPSPRGLLALTRKLPPGLNRLLLTGISLDSPSLTLLSQALPQTLRELELGRISLSTDSAAALSKGLNPGLRTVSIGELLWEGSPAQIKNAQQNFFSRLPSGLQFLDLEAGSLGPTGGEVLAANWPENLRLLNLWNNGLTDAEVSHLVRTLPPTLYGLQIRSNQVSTLGLKAIADTRLPNLVALNLSGNPVSVDGIRDLCNASLGHSSYRIRSLNLTHTGTDRKILNALVPGCSQHVQRMYVGNNPIGNQAIAEFFRKASPFLYAINLPSIGLSRIGFDEVARSMPKYLNFIEINGNPIGSLGYDKLKQEAEKRKKYGIELLISR